METVGTNVVVQTAAFTEENGSLSYPTDLSGYNRLQAQLKSRSRTEKPVKQATYTFGSENGTLYLLSCREADSVTASSPSVQSQPGTTTAPTTEPVWTNPTSDPPSLLDKVTWKGSYDPEPVMLILSANALNGKLDLRSTIRRISRPSAVFGAFCPAPSTAGYLLSDRNGVSSGKARI